jgi:diacylglycerol kinase
MTTISRFIRSVRHAWRGLCIGFKGEKNFRIQTAVGLLVLVGLLIFPVPRGERLLVLVVLVIVLVLELLNSSMERLLDLLQPRLNEYVGDVKDMMAGAVLLASLCAALIGLFVFAPHILSLFVRV